MKIRQGFVTNSSSSSFILAYNDETSLSQKLEQEISDYVIDENNKKECLEILEEKLNKSKNQKDDLHFFFEKLKTSYYYKIKYEYEEELRQYMGWRTAYDIVRSDVGEKEIKRRVNDKINQLKEEINTFNIIKKISISDDYDVLSQLEKIIVPKLSICKEVFNNH